MDSGRRILPAIARAAGGPAAAAALATIPLLLLGVGFLWALELTGAAWMVFAAGAPACIVLVLSVHGDAPAPPPDDDEPGGGGGGPRAPEPPPDGGIDWAAFDRARAAWSEPHAPAGVG